MITMLPVWVSYPLKQGLKHAFPNSSEQVFRVWVSYPLKQGLKRQETGLILASFLRLSQLSIKTRIETVLDIVGESILPGLSQLSIKTRIET